MDISATQSVMLTAQDILLENAQMLNSPQNQTVPGPGGFIMVQSFLSSVPCFVLCCLGARKGMYKGYMSGRWGTLTGVDMKTLICQKKGRR